METQKRQPKTTGLRRRTTKKETQPKEEITTQETQQESAAADAVSSSAAEPVTEQPVSAKTEAPEPNAASAASSAPAEDKSDQEAVEQSATDLVTTKPEHAEEEPRFHYFIIDSGWKSPAAKVLRENFHMIREFQNHDPLYVLTREQSTALIRANSDLIGKDPILLVHDLHAKGGRGESGYHGFRLCLGAIKKPEQVLKALQEFLQFVSLHRNSSSIEKDLQRKLHRQGVEGAIEVIREGASEMMA